MCALPTLYLCVLYLSQKKTATCATYTINWLVFITEMKSVYCAVRTGSLIKQSALHLWRVTNGIKPMENNFHIEINFKSEWKYLNKYWQILIITRNVGCHKAYRKMTIIMLTLYSLVATYVDLIPSVNFQTFSFLSTL